MRSQRLLVALLAAGVLGTACSGAPSGGKPLAVGRPAPGFDLPSAAGNVDLAELRGRPVLLYFSMGPG